MKVLLLSPYPEKLETTIKDSGDEVISYCKKINEEFLSTNNIEFLVSYGYRYKLNSSLLKLIDYKAINLHLSYLPFNKGAYPNLWSHIDNTPSGVTIHLMDDDLDTGKILSQKKVFIDKYTNTFKTSYFILTEEIERLISLNWDYFRENQSHGIVQKGRGTFHTIKDSKSVIKYLERGWDTNINEFLEFYKNK